MGRRSHQHTTKDAPSTPKGNGLASAQFVAGYTNGRTAQPGYMSHKDAQVSSWKDQVTESLATKDSGRNALPPAWYTDTIAPRSGALGLSK
jgi:hypothetical protein